MMQKIVIFCAFSGAFWNFLSPGIPHSLSRGGFANVPPHCSGPTPIEAQRRTVTQPAGMVGLPKGRGGRYLKTWADLTLAFPSRTVISCPGEPEAPRC